MRVSCLTAAIVLRVRPFGESDKIVTFLTAKQGKVTGIAKGAKNSRRRFVNSLEPLAQVTLHYQDQPHGRLAFLLSAQLAFIYKSLTQNLDILSHAFYLIEITDGLIGDGDENRAVFEHLKNALCYLDEKKPTLRFLTVYELELLRLTGYQPVLDRCKQCRTIVGDVNDVWFFSSIDGGLLCRNCSIGRQELTSVSLPAAMILTELQKEANFSAPVTMLSGSVVREIRGVVSGFVRFQMNREIKSASFLSRSSESECPSPGIANYSTSDQK